MKKTISYITFLFIKENFKHKITSINWEELLDLWKEWFRLFHGLLTLWFYRKDKETHILWLNLIKCLPYILSVECLGLLESLWKLDTRDINSIVRKILSQKKNFYINSLKHAGTIVTLARISWECYYSKSFKENKKDSKRIWSAIRIIVNVKPSDKHNL